TLVAALVESEEHEVRLGSLRCPGGGASGGCRDHDLAIAGGRRHVLLAAIEVDRPQPAELAAFIEGRDEEVARTGRSYRGAADLCGAVQRPRNDDVLAQHRDSGGLDLASGKHGAPERDAGRVEAGEPRRLQASTVGQRPSSEVDA